MCAVQIFFICKILQYFINYSVLSAVKLTNTSREWFKVTGILLMSLWKSTQLSVMCCWMIISKLTACFSIKNFRHTNVLWTCGEMQFNTEPCTKVDDEFGGAQLDFYVGYIRFDMTDTYRQNNKIFQMYFVSPKFSFLLLSGPITANSCIPSRSNHRNQRWAESRVWLTCHQEPVHLYPQQHPVCLPNHRCIITILY